MKTQHIVIGLVAVGAVGGFLYWRSTRPATQAVTTKSSLEQMAERLRGLFNTKPTANTTKVASSAEPTARSDVGGLDITSPYGNESMAL